MTKFMCYFIPWNNLLYFATSAAYNIFVYLLFFLTKMYIKMDVNQKNSVEGFIFFGKQNLKCN